MKDKLLVIESIEEGFHLDFIIGVASDLDNAVRMVNEYYGLYLTLEDVQQREMVYIIKLNNIDGSNYTVMISNFLLNRI